MMFPVLWKDENRLTIRKQVFEFEVLDECYLTNEDRDNKQKLLLVKHNNEIFWIKESKNVTKF